MVKTNLSYIKGTVEIKANKENRMLILSRKRRQKLFIGEDITITVLSVHRGQTRLGIDAPKNESIDREEVLLRKRQEQEISNTGKLEDFSKSLSLVTNSEVMAEENPA